jgi:hypothetical protein
MSAYETSSKVLLALLATRDTISTMIVPTTPASVSFEFEISMTNDLSTEVRRFDQYDNSSSSILNTSMF